MRLLKRLPLLLILASLSLICLGLTGCATLNDQGKALHRAQYDWSAAIRWGDFEGAWTLVDPEYRQAHPLTDLETERYQQIRIAAYRDHAARATGSTAQRQIEIGVINRHTLVRRSVRYTENWRWDAKHKRWWITDGLPDLWPE